MAPEILDVDLLRFESGSRDARDAATDGVLRSLETGFVYLAHDLPADLLDEAYGRLQDFFGLDEDAKRACVVPHSNGQSGYTGTLVETAADSDLPDWKEMLNWGHELPEGHPLRRRYPHRYMPRRFVDDYVPGMTETLGRLYDRLLDLQRRFLRIVAVGVGYHEDYFDEMTRDGATLCRAIRYPPMADAPSGEHEWAGSHADINLVTVLPRATARGLQVELQGAWVDAVPPEGRAILNTGLMLERVSNGRIPAGMHRVVASGDPTQERISVVQFCHPTPSTILAPLQTCVTDDRPPRHAPITAGDWLDQVLYDINLVEDERRLKE